MKNPTTLPTTYGLFDSVYGNEIPTDQYFVHNFDCIPSKFLDSTLYSLDVVEKIKEMGFIEITSVTTYNKRHSRKLNNRLFMNKDKKLFIHYGESVSNKEKHCTLSYYFNLESGEIEKQIKLKEFEKFSIEKDKSGISLLRSESGYLDTENYILEVPEVDLGLNYGGDFLKLHEVIIKRLNEPKGKGIILLHGEPGTGKTTYIKYLTKLVKDKEILFVPPTMAESLSDPSIIPFLMEHTNSILIIEDSERIISDREGDGSSVGVSNILNLTDGILGDCLGIQIVATFNMTREKIDPALLRKGRLIAEHKFGKLSIEDSNKLLKSLGKKETVDTPTTLTDLFNIEEELIKEKDTARIGF